MHTKIQLVRKDTKNTYIKHIRMSRMRNGNKKENKAALRDM